MSVFLAALKVAAVLLALISAALIVLRLAHPLPAPVDAPVPAPELAGAGGDGALAAAALRLGRDHPGQTGIALLADGPGAFAARVSLIDSAQTSIDAQYYIWKADLTGSMLLAALKRAADRGVRVRLLLDDHGVSGLDRELAELDAHPHAAVQLFNPFMLRWPKWLNFAFDFRRLNRRMHNKSLTIDGTVAIVGGRNIGDAYFGAGDATLFIDLDVIAVGAAVPAVAVDFERYWQADAAYPASMILSGHDGGDAVGQRAAALAVDPAAAGFRSALGASDAVTRLREERLVLEWTNVTLVSDSPAKALDKAKDDELLFSHLTEILDRPSQRLDLVTAYLVPGRRGTAALARLARSGVEVRVLTNALEATDVVPVHAGYAKRRRALLRAGVELFELRRRDAGEDGESDARSLGPLGSSGGSLHAKTFAVDGRVIYVGSFNFDMRSLRLNTEMGFVIRSERLARQLHDSLTERLPAVAYRPALLGKSLVWHDGRHVLRHEPGASAMKRAVLALVNWLPVEWLL